VKALRYLALSIAAVLFLLPFYLVIRNGLATEAEITAQDWKLVPDQVHWENFAELFSDPAVPMVRSMVNCCCARSQATASHASRTGTRTRSSTPSSPRS
jgi:ABC-type glycerol-3-phosphate transport system permease component